MVKRAILVAGHGGGDPGATGQGTTEAAECIQIVNRLADKLRADGQLEVVVVPHELGLIDSINWINARFGGLEDGLCIEVHKNSTVNAHGIEVWYWGGDSQSAGLAQKMLDGIMSVAGMPVSRGIKGDNTNRWGSLGFIRETNPWALLAEMGFVSDGGDGVDDASDDRYSEGLKIGFLREFGLSPKANPVPVPLPPPPANEKPAPTYRVYSNDAQLGAYNTESGAWNKYADPNAHAVKIVEVASGKDVTAQFVEKYRPKVEQPAPGAEPHPVYDPAKDNQQDARLGALEIALGAITKLLSAIADAFKNWRS